MHCENWKTPAEAALVPANLLNAGYSPLLAAVLHARGIDSPRQAADYLSRDRSLLCDPFLLADMDKAVERIERAVAEKEKIAIYGDYDVDGISASCLLFQYLKSRGVSCSIYIPDRIDEGYGINAEALLSIKQSGVSLIITVDCGITAGAEVLYAHQLGMDTIITDHHQCPPELPEACAVIDPQRRDCTYPYKFLAGVGVAFKLVCALEGNAELPLERYCQLVAAGTVADVMPLTGENRYLVYAGLEMLKKAPLPGFAALLEQAGAGEKPITTVTLGFTVAPRINAAGRLCQTETAVSLLNAESRQEAEEYASQLCRLNLQRQTMEAKVCAAAEAILKDSRPCAPIVLAGEDWHPGIVGIAASKIAEQYRLPAVVICLEGDKGKGSCRSYGDFNLFEAFTACQEHLELFGGHAFAAGISIKRDKIDDFRSALTQYYQQHPPVCPPSTEAELKITDLSLLDMDSVSSLSLLEPCGSCNPNPVFYLPGALLENITPIGKGKHLRLKISKNGVKLDGVMFSRTAQELGVDCGQQADICFVPQINEFHSSCSVQLIINDLRPAGGEDKCLSLLVGERPPLDELQLFRPDREQLGKLWRCLDKLCGENPHQPVFLSLQDAAPSSPLELCLGLEIFQELNLIKVSYEDILIKIDILSSEKNPLVNSPLYRSLWNMD